MALAETGVELVLNGRDEAALDLTAPTSPTASASR